MYIHAVKVVWACAGMWMWMALMEYLLRLLMVLIFSLMKLNSFSRHPHLILQNAPLSLELSWPRQVSGHSHPSHAVSQIRLLCLASIAFKCQYFKRNQRLQTIENIIMIKILCIWEINLKACTPTILTQIIGSGPRFEPSPKLYITAWCTVDISENPPEQAISGLSLVNTCKFLNEPQCRVPQAPAKAVSVLSP